jgi:acetolactate synthase-1/2/3 large subunit
MWVHEAMAAAIADMEVNTMFGLIGDSNLFMVDRFVQHGGNYISAVHEAGAVMMAHGYAVRSGRLGVATVTQGPGLTNTATALVETTRSGTPMVLITGDTAPGNTLNPQSLIQEPFVRATGAEYLLVVDPNEAATSFEKAARMAVHLRRPVVLNCPTEYQWNYVEYSPMKPSQPGASLDSPIDESSLDVAVGVIASSRRPLVLVGSGVLQGSDQADVLQFARRIGAPIATTLRARGLFSASEGCVGVFGTLSTDTGAQVISEADCVIAFGASLNAWTTARNGLLTNKSLVHVDSNFEHINRYSPVTAGVVGSAGAVAKVMYEWIEEADIPATSFLSEISPRLTESSIRWSANVADGYNIGSVISEIVGALPEETTIVFDGGRFLGEAFKYAAARTPERQVLSTSFGAVGMGMGAALGAAAAAPDHPTLLITGDGGYMMSGMAEFQSSVRNDLPLIVVVCNDASYGAEYDQFVNKSISPDLSLFAWPSLAGTAAALGAAGVTIEGKEDLPAALKLLADPLAGSILIDIKIDASDIPEVPH